MSRLSAKNYDCLYHNLWREALVSEIFDGRTLAPLSAEHGVFNAHFKLKPGTRMEGLNYGCRTAIIYAPKACATTWEANRISDEDFKIGANVILYAVDREGLSDRLAGNPRLPRKGLGVTSGALSVGQIRRSGDGFTDLEAMPKLLSFCAQKLNMNVATVSHPVGLLDGDLFHYPVLYLEGHAGFELSPEEIRRLRLYLDRGGFLIAEARCAAPAFDASFRELALSLYPEERLAMLARDHDIYVSAFDATRVTFRRSIRGDHPEGIPWLEGLTVDNRLAIVYTKYDLGSGWNGELCSWISGLEPDSALALGANIIVYALTH